MDKPKFTININAYHDVLARFKYTTLPFAEYILDVGSGPCLFRTIYPYTGSKITFLDMDDSDGNAFNIAKKELSDNPDYSFITGCSDDLSMLDDDSFDMVNFSQVFEHLTPDQIDKTMREINRVLKTDGLLILGTPAKEGRILTGNYKAHPGHIEEYTHDEMLSYFTMYGFLIANRDFCLVKLEVEDDMLVITNTIHDNPDSAYTYFYVCKKVIK